MLVIAAVYNAVVCVIIRISRSNAQEAFVDGVKVFSESGRKHEKKRNKWLRNPLKYLTKRRKSKDYELHVVEDGMEVRLDNEVVWAIGVA